MGQNVQKVPARQMWQDFDKDGSGVLDRNEVDALLKHIWKTYKVQKPLSPDVVKNVLEELDKSKDGKIVQAEFEDLYDDLWEEMSQMYANSATPAKAAESGAKASPKGGSSPRGAKTPPQPAPPKAVRHSSPKAKVPNNIRCPHCAFEIDPRQLHRLKVPPEALGVVPGPWQRPDGGGYQTPAAIAAPPLPPGTTLHGQVPSSFFHSSHGWWAQPSGSSP
ncbi:unnamed protein product [Symbiodinium natans]|uniref:EF-hand domain-containing protein n=1 Tax=Symbiodinium natans TaxID=878477 RepID=A0A812RIG7_9DINO|nr:unnamed protein product [Symbiodinium natans]